MPRYCIAHVPSHANKQYLYAQVWYNIGSEDISRVEHVPKSKCSAYDKGSEARKVIATLPNPEQYKVDIV